MHDAPAPYTIAGILVRTHSADLVALTKGLSALPGVEVHHREPESGRLVITLETVGVDDQQRRLDEVRRQAGVVSAELVFHYTAPPVGGVTAGE